MFESPDTLRKYALEVAAQLKIEGFLEESKILKERANLVSTSGWEWLGELGLGIEKIICSNNLSSDMIRKLKSILKATKSSKPYG